MGSSTKYFRRICELDENFVEKKYLTTLILMETRKPTGFKSPAAKLLEYY